MATINVIYEDLYNTTKALDKVIDYIESAKSQLDTIKKTIDELDSNHKCFSITSNEINSIERDFENYSTEVSFLKKQCNNAANAFKNAEGENVKLTDAMKGVISDAAIMIGDETLKDNPEINVFKNRDAFTKSGKTLETTPGVDTSETWNNTFVDENNDKLVEINADISSDASTILDSEEKTEKDTETDTSSNSTSDYNDYSGGDNGSRGHNSDGGSASYSPTYTPTNSTTTSTTPTNTNQAITTPTNTSQTNTADSISDVNIVDKNQKTNTTPTTNDSSKSNADTTASNNSSNINNPQQANPTPSDYSQLDANKANSSEVSGFQPTGNQNETYSSTTPTYNYVGGSYSEDTGYISSNEENGLEEMINKDLETPDDSPLIDDAGDSIEDIIQRGRTTKIPTSSVPIQPTVKSTGNSVIPIAAGLSAAAAAGIGAKAYIDHKNNSISNDDIDTEDWSEDDSLLEVEDNNSNTNEELSTEDEYSYQQSTEKYSTRDTSEITEI